jgi:hypothetical protein
MKQYRLDVARAFARVFLSCEDSKIPYSVEQLRSALDDLNAPELPEYEEQE